MSRVATDVVPECINYSDKPETPFEGERRRRTVALYPTQSGGIQSSQSSRVIKFQLGNESLLDPVGTYLSFKAQASKVGGAPGDTIQFVEYSECMIKRLTILTANGSRVVEDIRDYHVLAAMMRRKMAPAYATSVGNQCLGMFEGAADPDAVAQARALQKCTYISELAGSGLLGGNVQNRKPYLPLRAISGPNSNSLIIEIEFVSAEEACIITDGAGGPGTATPSYEISEIIIYQDLVDDLEAEQAIMQSVKAGTPLALHYDTHTHYQQRLAQNIARSTYSVSEFQQSIKDMHVSFRPSTAISNKDSDETEFANPELLSYQLQVGSKYYPSQPVKVGSFQNADQYYELAKANHVQRRYDDGFQKVVFDVSGSTDADESEFMLGMNLRVYGDDCGSQPDSDFFSGLNTQTNPQPLQLNLDLTSHPISYIVDLYVLYDRFMVVGDNTVEIMS